MNFQRIEKIHELVTASVREDWDAFHPDIERIMGKEMADRIFKAYLRTPAGMKEYDEAMNKFDATDLDADLLDGARMAEAEFHYECMMER